MARGNGPGQETQPQRVVRALLRTRAGRFGTSLDPFPAHYCRHSARGRALLPPGHVRGPELPTYNSGRREIPDRECHRRHTHLPPRLINGSEENTIEVLLKKWPVGPE